ncbi:MAG: 6-carboxytetrahydropterin synthase QueD [Anaerolineae bacterium]|nr:6-carboxytetrahydropterin synthase QueD [Anaerolineae bacterium]
MYRANVRRHFESAHALRGYRGKCENVHGHRYEVVVSFETAELNALGLAVDFREIKQLLDAILERFDHQNLNDIPPFDKINPSAENIARVIYDALADSPGGAMLREVQVWESPDAWATYSP